MARPQSERIKISWSGRKRCHNNILVERTWRTVKYEEVYLHAYSDYWDAEISLVRFLWRYCHVRSQSALGGNTPHELYTETESCSSRPGLTMSGARTVQQKASISGTSPFPAATTWLQVTFQHTATHHQ